MTESRTIMRKPERVEHEPGREEISTPREGVISSIRRMIFGSSDLSRYAGMILLVLCTRLLFHYVVFNTLGEQYDWSMNDDYDEIAENIIEGNGYVAVRGQAPDTSRTPLYVFFLVALFYVAGTGALALIISQSLLQALSCILLYKLSREVFDDRNLAMFPALCLILLPQSMLYATYLHPESLYLLFSVATAVYFFRLWKIGAMRWAPLAGAMAGFMTLTKPVAQLLVLPLAVGFLLHHRHNLLFGLKRSALLSLSFVVVVAPWVIRNYYVEGEFISVASRGGRFFHQATIKENQGDADIMERIEEEGREDQSVNEETRWVELAIRNILDQPGQFVLNLGRNFIEFWYRGHYLTVSLLNALTNFSLLILAIFGFMEGRRKDVIVAPFLLIILYFNLVHSFLFSLARYSYPVIPFVIMFAMYWLFTREKILLVTGGLRDRPDYQMGER